MAGGLADLGNSENAERFKARALPHLDAVYTLARYLLRNSSDADDAVQECYLRAFRHFDTFRGGPIKPWLMAILRNACHDVRVGNAKLDYTTDNGDTKTSLANPIWCEDSETPDQTLLRQQETKTMRRLIDELPTEFKEVIVLREINDSSYRDIATATDAPIGTVMSRLARARKMLRDAWIAAEGGVETK